MSRLNVERDTMVLDYIEDHPNSKSVDIASALYPERKTAWCSVVCNRLSRERKIIKIGLRYSMVKELKVVSPEQIWCAVPKLGNIDPEDLLNIKEQLLTVAGAMVRVFPNSKSDTSEFLAKTINQCNRACAIISLMTE